MIKRLIALTLCLIMAVSVFASCSIKKNKDDKGAIIKMYITEEIYDFDPAYAFKNDSTLKIVNLMFSTLFTVNENGKVEKLLAEDYTIDKSKNSMIITIREDAFWSDGTYVSANDVVYTFKRLLDPEFTSEAACLLYDVKNARSIKNATSDYYIDDIGVFPVGEREVEITFEEGFTNYDQFLENLASPALAPLREDIVSVNEDDWAKKPGTMACSGPFMLRKVSYNDVDKGITLERNPYYFRQDKDAAVDKSVKPYRIIIDYTKSAAEQLDMYKRGEIFYIGDIAIENRDDLKRKVELKDAMSTTTIYLNENAYIGENVYTIDKEEVSDPRESFPEDTKVKTITTTYTTYITYYNHMAEEEYNSLYEEAYEPITKRDFKKDYTPYKTRVSTEIKVENGETVHYVSKYEEYRYTVVDNNDVKHFVVDTPYGTKLFADKNVRQALSLIIDREALADMVVYAKAATALVPYGVFSKVKSGSFRKNGGEIISTGADKEAAEKCIADAGINPAEFEILLTVEAKDAVHCLVAYEVEKAWESLGFKVIVSEVYPETNDEIGSTGEVAKDIVDDVFSEDLYARTFQATIVDIVAPTAHAFSILAPFAKEFAGTAMDLGAKDADGNYIYAIEGHITGYNNDEYNKKIDEAFAEKNEKKRTAILHEAEEILLADMPVIPLIFNQDAYMISGKLSKVDSTYYGTRVFTDAKLRNYKKYLDSAN